MVLGWQDHSFPSMTLHPLPKAFAHKAAESFGKSDWVRVISFSSICQKTQKTSPSSSVIPSLTQKKLGSKVEPHKFLHPLAEKLSHQTQETQETLEVHLLRFPGQLIQHLRGQEG